MVTHTPASNPRPLSHRGDNPIPDSLRFTVEFGVGGYSAGTTVFVADSTPSMLTQIADAYSELIIEVERSDEEHGDLREYCPEFANGYPSYDGSEDVTCCVISMEELKLVDITTPQALNLMHHVITQRVHG